MRHHAGMSHAVALTLAAAMLTQVSLLWDISWHMSIGRDSFWTPAHIGLYLGGLIPGAVCAAQVLRATWGAPGAPVIQVLGLRGASGAFVTLWGAVAMLVSAPFDDWWHGAYGLDITVYTPPHLLLVSGMTALLLGATLLLAAWANDQAVAGRAALLQVVAAGLLVLMAGTLALQASNRIFMHSSGFYLLGALLFPFVLTGATVSRIHWPMACAAAVYTLVRLLLAWGLPLFPAEPRLGPVFFSVSHMVPPDFPLLLIVPALLMDVCYRRTDGWTPERRAVLLGLVFLLSFAPLQWLFADLLLSAALRGWLLATDSFRYNLTPGGFAARQVFYPWDTSRVGFFLGMLLAATAAMGSARLGLGWASLQRRVRR